MIAVPTSTTNWRPAALLAKLINVDFSNDATPLLAITDDNGKLLGQLRRKNLVISGAPADAGALHVFVQGVQGQKEIEIPSPANAPAVDFGKVEDFLKQHAQPTINARELLTDAFDQAPVAKTNASCCRERRRIASRAYC